jgi:polysaccharide export outer membrane protein
MRWLIFSAVIAIGVFSALNWRAQLQTQQKLDALTSALSKRPAAPVPPTPPAPPAPPVTPLTLAAAQEPRAMPRELGVAKLSPYIIEAPDMLTIEVVVKDPKTGEIARLPNQPISGPFLVRPDGTVGLGMWGSVFVAGLTMDQAAQRVRERVARARPGEPAENLIIVVDVLAYNSKCYYVITDLGANGEQVVRLPCTGSDTVLDALSQLGGLVQLSKKTIWISRRSTDGGPVQVLHVDWTAITRQGETKTNYQLLPGDRLYITDAGTPASLAPVAPAPSLPPARIAVPNLGPIGLPLDVGVPVMQGPDDKRQLFNFSVGIFGGR